MRDTTLGSARRWRRATFNSIGRRPIRMIGWREWVGLPQLSIPLIKAKIDTGARTSALCAQNIQVLTSGGAACVAFTVPVTLNDEVRNVDCIAPLLGTRTIKNTGGVPEDRYIIRTRLAIGRHRWQTEISLANRSNMGFDLILGRKSLRGHSFRVNPARSFLTGSPTNVKNTSTGLAGGMQ